MAYLKVQTLVWQRSPSHQGRVDVLVPLSQVISEGPLPRGLGGAIVLTSGQKELARAEYISELDFIWYALFDSVRRVRTLQVVEDGISQYCDRLRIERRPNHTMYLGSKDTMALVDEPQAIRAILTAAEEFFAAIAGTRAFGAQHGMKQVLEARQEWEREWAPR